MYLERVTSAIGAELDVPVAQDTVAPSGDYLNNRIHFVKGIIIASSFFRYFCDVIPNKPTDESDNAGRMGNPRPFT